MWDLGRTWVLVSLKSGEHYSVPFQHPHSGPGHRLQYPKEGLHTFPTFLCPALPSPPPATARMHCLSTIWSSDLEKGQFVYRAIFQIWLPFLFLSQ